MSQANMSGKTANMTATAVVRPLVLDPDRRTMIISDIHGNLPWFQALLAKAGFSREDILVLVGDLVEKGRDSLATLRYIMELSATHTVYALCGNCDNLAVDFIYGNGELGRDFYRFYLSVGGESAYFADGRGGGDGSERARGPARSADVVAGAIPVRTGVPAVAAHHSRV